MPTQKSSSSPTAERRCDARIALCNTLIYKSASLSHKSIDASSKVQPIRGLMCLRAFPRISPYKGRPENFVFRAALFPSSLHRNPRAHPAVLLPGLAGGGVVDHGHGRSVGELPSAFRRPGQAFSLPDLYYSLFQSTVQSIIFPMAKAPAFAFSRRPGPVFLFSGFHAQGIRPVSQRTSTSGRVRTPMLRRR